MMLKRRDNSRRMENRCYVLYSQKRDQGKCENFLGTVTAHLTTWVYERIIKEKCMWEAEDAGFVQEARVWITHILFKTVVDTGRNLHFLLIALAKVYDTVPVEKEMGDGKINTNIIHNTKVT